MLFEELFLLLTSGLFTGVSFFLPLKQLLLLLQLPLLLLELLLLLLELIPQQL